MKNIYCVFIFVITCIAVCICKAPFAGPFDVIFRSTFKCSNDTDAFKYRLRIGRLNRTHFVLNETIFGNLGFRDTMRASFDLSVFGNGGWKEHFMHAELQHACSDMEKFLPGLVKSILAAAGVEFTGCPIPPGSYYIKNWIFHNNLALPVFPYGRYKLTAKIFENDTLLTCAGGEGDVVPKAVTTRRKKH